MNSLWSHLIYGQNREKSFAGLSVMTVADLLKPPPVRVEIKFSQFCDRYNMKHLPGLQLGHLFQYAKLRGQNNNLTNFESLKLEARFIHESDENYPKHALHMYAQNEPTIKRNYVVLNELLSELYTIEANDKILDNYRYSLVTIEAAQNQNQPKKSLEKLLKLHNWLQSNS